MYRIMSLFFLPGCAVLPMAHDNSCSSYAEVLDETTGEMDFWIDDDDDGHCEPVVPNRVLHSRMFFAEGEERTICNNATQEVYGLSDLEVDELHHTPFDEENPGRVEWPGRGTFEDGEWVHSIYAKADEDMYYQPSGWGVVYQWGTPGTALNLSGCWGEE